MITIQAKINAPIHHVWEKYTNPMDIMQWNSASEEWHCPAAINDLKIGGKFAFTMAAKDDSHQFIFSGIYTDLQPLKTLAYTLDDERKVHITFAEKENYVLLTLTFEPENTHPEEFQQQGWQAILNNFKTYVEQNN